MMQLAGGNRQGHLPQIEHGRARLRARRDVDPRKPLAAGPARRPVAATSPPASCYLLPCIGGGAAPRTPGGRGPLICLFFSARTTCQQPTCLPVPRGRYVTSHLRSPSAVRLPPVEYSVCRSASFY
ncbi:hypothetical protein PVAP13_6KG270006 [Panicum virgatum]|uniref:Uncharacterized protein n=1 Tax=Panicum virgatum TaxID=38727 RepID=A0A8T0RG15_PANVG|nr:hypothetical protein PVAP13_6KG270006 [Panicum virgatum]